MSKLLLALIALAPLTLHAQAKIEDRLFYQMGGEKTLRHVVDVFAEVILSDARINFAFAGTNMDRFKQLIYAQLCELAAGPCIYDGRDMRAAHAALPITNAQFNALAEDLYIAFDRAGVSYSLQNKMMAMLATMQREIVKR